MIIKKLKFKDVVSTRRNMFDRVSWLKSKTKKNDLKCQNCGVMYADLSTEKISAIQQTGQAIKHVCNECLGLYIADGARDTDSEIEKANRTKDQLVKEIRSLNFYNESNRYNRKLDVMKMEELEGMLGKHLELKAKKDRIDAIDAIVISDEESTIEEYLVEDYGVIQDVVWLKTTEQIKDYFEDCGRDHFDCGQGYLQDEADVIIKIASKFYSVHVTAEIGSAKQDIGDRLYWVESIEKVSWEEIDKPLPKLKETYDYWFVLSEDRKKELDRLLKHNGFEFTHG